jgi:hypothetical protein
VFSCRLWNPVFVNQHFCVDVFYVKMWHTACECRGTWSDNKVRELKRATYSLLNITVIAFKVLPLGICAPMPAPSPPFKTIFELVLWNGLQSNRRIIPDVINVIKMPSFQYFLYLREQKNVTGDRSSESGGCSSTVICLLAKNSLIDSALIQAPTFSRRHTKPHSDNNRRHSERDCHRSTTT